MKRYQKRMVKNAAIMARMAKALIDAANENIIYDKKLTKEDIEKQTDMIYDMKNRFFSKMKI